MDEPQLSALFSAIPVGEVWGIGRRISAQLNEIGISTIQDLRSADSEYIRQQFSVVVERTVKELNGIPCVELEDVAVPRQQIMVSRSFGNEVSQLAELSESISYYATLAAEKLRHDASVASSLCIFVRTNPFKDDVPQYSRSIVVPLPRPSDDTLKLVHAALQGLKQIFRSGYGYKKSGVLLMGLQPKGTIQASLFDEPEAQAKSDSMMRVMDAINRKMGQGSVVIASSGVRPRWAMRREKKTPSYTTEWSELPVAG